MKKRILAVLVLVFILVGCARTESKTEKKDEKIQIHIAQYWGETDTDESARSYRKIINEEFEKEFPNIELVQDSYDNETYKRKIKVLMASDEAPDIMFSYGGGFAKAFVESGKVLDLDEYLSDYYKEKTDKNMQENFIYNDKQYGICYAYWTGVLYCNKKLFEEAGATIPQTYEELLDVSRQLREKNIQPIACGMLDKWMGQQWINNFTIQMEGAENYRKMAAGEISLDNKSLAESADLVQGLIRADAFCDKMYELTSSESEEMFLDGEAAMIYIGNWYTASAVERLGEDVAVARMPIVPEANYTNDYHGGGSNGWMVSSETKYPKEATEIIEWLSYRLSCYQPQVATFKVDERDLMANIEETDQAILDLYKNKGMGGCAWDTLMVPGRAATWLDLCGQLYDLKFSGDGFVKLLRSQIDWGMEN